MLFLNYWFLALLCSIHYRYVHTAEMLPTVIRSIGVGSASTVARLGALIAPFVPLLVIAHAICKLKSITFLWKISLHRTFYCVFFSHFRTTFIDHCRCSCSVAYRSLPEFYRSFYPRHLGESYQTRYVKLFWFHFFVHDKR